MSASFERWMHPGTAQGLKKHQSLGVAAFLMASLL